MTPAGTWTRPRVRTWLTGAAARAVAAAVLSGVAVVPTAAGAAPGAPVTAVARPAARIQHYVPPAGASFNNPLGTAGQQRKLLTQVIRTTNSAPPGSTIRMAVFSFGDGRTADALLAAYRRGVRVKLVFAGENVYPAMARLRDAIGTDTSRGSFVVVCDHSCRGDRGQMHAKYFSFSRAGAARWITMVGSVNLTQYNAQDQWNDLYTRVEDRPYFKLYGRWFGQLKDDRPVASTYLHRSTATTDVTFAPFDLTERPDPVLTALQQVRCLVPMGEIDPASATPDEQVATRLLISTHAWNEERGKTIAWQVARLRGEGCVVRVFYGTGMGAAVRSILEHHDVEMSAGTHRSVRTHQKVMVVDGGYADEPDTVRAWTGSQNWSTRALGRDDLLVRVDEEVVAQQYADRFDWVWRRG